MARLPLEVDTWLEHPTAPAQKEVWVSNDQVGRRWVFADDQARYITQQLRLPPEFNSDYATLEVVWGMASAVTGNVVYTAKVMKYTPDSDTAAADSDSFASLNTTGALAVPATTAGRLKTTSIDLVNDDGAVAGDLVWLVFGRLPADANDSAAGAAECYDFNLDFTAA